MKFPYSNFHDLNTDWIISKIKELTAKVEALGSGGGTSDFNQLSNRPSYNSTTMTNATDVPLVKTAVWDGKQDALVSGTNIKTINSNSLLGSGDVTLTASEAVTIAVADWNGGTTCTKSVTGVTASNNIIVSPDPSSFSDYANAVIRATAQASGTVTFECDTTPSSDISVNVLIVG